MPDFATRVRKAWHVSHRDYLGPRTVFAPTAAKAKYEVCLDLLDAGWHCTTGEALRALSVRRAAEADLHLPCRHWIADALPAEYLSVVTHAYGVTGSRSLRREPGWRDYFCSEPGDRVLLSLAWEWGLFRGPYLLDDVIFDSLGVFFLTELGRRVAMSAEPEYPGHG